MGVGVRVCMCGWERRILRIDGEIVGKNKSKSIVQSPHTHTQSINQTNISWMRVVTTTTTMKATTTTNNLTGKPTKMAYDDDDDDEKTTKQQQEEETIFDGDGSNYNSNDKKNGNNNYEIKIVVVGSGRCGKTSLLKLLLVRLLQQQQLVDRCNNHNHQLDLDLDFDLDRLENIFDEQQQQRHHHRQHDDEEKEELNGTLSSLPPPQPQQPHSEMIYRYRITSSSSSSSSSSSGSKAVEEKSFVDFECGLNVKEYHFVQQQLSSSNNIDIILEEIGGSCDINKLTRYFEKGGGEEKKEKKKGRNNRKKKSLSNNDSSSNHNDNGNNIDCLIFVADLLKETSMYDEYDEKVFELIDNFITSSSSISMSMSSMSSSSSSKSELDRRTKIPLLIVGNKFDDPTNPALIERAGRIQNVLSSSSAAASTSTTSTAAATTTTDSSSTSSSGFRSMNGCTTSNNNNNGNDDDDDELSNNDIAADVGGDGPPLDRRLRHLHRRHDDEGEEKKEEFDNDQYDSFDDSFFDPFFTTPATMIPNTTRDSSSSGSGSGIGSDLAIIPNSDTGFVAISCRRAMKAAAGLDYNESSGFGYDFDFDEDRLGYYDDDEEQDGGGGGGGYHINYDDDKKTDHPSDEQTSLGRIQNWLYENVLNEPAMMELLERQHLTTLTNLKPSDPMLVSKLRRIYNSPAVCSSSSHRHLLVNQDDHHHRLLPSYYPNQNNDIGPQIQTTLTDPGSLMSRFWALYDACEDVALTRFNSRMEDIGVFERPLHHLKEYKILLEETKWEDPKVVVSGAISRLFLRQLNIIIEHNNCYSFAYWFQTMNDAMWRPSVAKEGRRAMMKISRTASKYSSLSSVSWKLLSPYDWATIYSSILVVASDRHFVEKFGKQKMLLDRLVSKSHDLIYQQHDSVILQSPSKPSHRISTEKRIQLEHNQPSTRNRIHRLFRGRQKSIDNEKDINGQNHGLCEDNVSLYDPFTTSDDCPSLSHALDGFYSLQRMGEFIPKYPETHGCVVNLEPPQLPSDPKHFGHVAWTYCNMMREYYDDDE